MRFRSGSLATTVCLRLLTLSTFVPLVARAQTPPPAPPSATASASAPAPTPPSAPSPTGAPGTPPLPSPAASAAAPEAPAAPAPSAPATPAPAATPAAPPASPNAAPAHVDVEVARVHLASNYPGTWLELRSSVDEGPWQRACAAPCDRALHVNGMLARAVAPDMTTSNAFRIDPGPGTALVKVEGGSSSHRTLGVVGLVTGIPIALAGMTLYSYGKVSDEKTTSTAGAIVLGTGAVIALIALPLLFSGRTAVKDGKGSMIAKTLAPPQF
ncbi:MAG TPA: hypothetical protein VGK73_18870 [Polyangiaceae bacterium]